MTTNSSRGRLPYREHPERRRRRGHQKFADRSPNSWRQHYDDKLPSLPTVNVQSSVNLPTVVFSKIGGKPVKTLVDTGSSITVIDEDTLKTVCPEAHARMRRGIFNNTKSADGTPVPLLGVTDIPITLGQTMIPFSLYVSSSIIVPMILGVDFLSCVKGTVDIGKRELLMNNTKVTRLYIDEEEDTQSSTAYTALIANDTTLKPKSRTLVRIELDSPYQPVPISGYERTVILEANRQANIATNVVFGRSINNVKIGQVSSLVDYVFEDEPKLKNSNSYSLQALFENTESTSAPVSQTTSNDSEEVTFVYDDDPQLNEDSWPRLDKQPEYDDAYPNVALNKSCLTKEQNKDFRKFLKYRKAFANRPEELTQTDVIEHDIDTLDAIPIRVPCYKTNPESRKEIERHLNSLLKRNLISVSSSPWSAPVILVKKKNGDTRMVTDFRRLNELSIKNFRRHRRRTARYFVRS